jgi:hypothetical protein
VLVVVVVLMVVVVVVVVVFVVMMVALMVAVVVVKRPGPRGFPFNGHQMSHSSARGATQRLRMNSAILCSSYSPSGVNTEKFTLSENTIPCLVWF